MTASGLFRETLSLTMRNWLLFGALALAGQVIVLGVMFLFGFGTLVTGEAGGIDSLGGGLFLAQLITLALSSILSGVLHLAAWDIMAGIRPNIGAYIQRSITVLLPLVVLSILFTLAVGLGIVFFIVPGLWIGAALSVVVPVIVIGDRGWGSLGVAFNLTEGYRWTIVGGFTLVLLVAIVVDVVVNWIGGVTGLTLVTGAIVGAIWLALQAAFVTLVYGHLVGDARVDVEAF